MIRARVQVLLHTTGTAVLVVVAGRNSHRAAAVVVRVRLRVMIPPDRSFYYRPRATTASDRTRAGR